MSQPTTLRGLHRIMAQPLGRTAGQPAARPGELLPDAAERCELCGTPVSPSGHRHLLDRTARELRCACRPCALLFDRTGAGGGNYQLVPDRRWHVRDFALDDAAWASLRIPVEMAFFFHDSAVARVVGFYPSPAGAVESLLDLATWAELERGNPVLARLAPDVEALLVNRARGARDHWLVPVDDCYRLVALIRTRWKGLAGGPQVWHDLTRFFADLGGRAKPMGADGRREPRPRAEREEHGHDD